MDKENAFISYGISCTELQCAVVVENLTAGGEVGKRTVYKKANMSLARNEFRDIVLTMNSEKTRTSLVVANVVLHAKFIKEGKASIVIDNRTRFFLSNCAVNQLAIFIKVLSSKTAKSTEVLPQNDRANVRKRLLSERPKGLTEISPLTINELKTTKQCEVQMTPKGSKKMRIDQNNELKKCRLDVSRPLLKSSLTIEQRMVLNFVLGGRNIFFTGSAGTGKSYLLKKIIQALPPESTFVTASTGVAAMQIGGITLHSFAGIGIGTANLEVSLKKIKTSNAVQHWKKCQHLIVDEISMIEGDYFAKLDQVARSIRKSDRPFGGIQLIVCGDFLQLPPVTRNNEKFNFCFETNAWDECIGVNMELKEIHRQRDKKLISILQAIRLGICTKEMSEVLLSTNKNMIDKDDIVATHLCTHNEDVDLINAEQLSSLYGESRTFVAIDSKPFLSSWLDKHCPVESRLTLKVGTQVMLLKNHDFQKGLVNGSRGIVVKFHEETGFPEVKFKSGQTITVGQVLWTIKGTGSEQMSRRQLPLKLAWALSIHKAQGMTLDCVKMSLSKVFECGQAYVGLSRASNLTGLQVLDFDRRCVRANPKVLEFYKHLRKPTGA